MLKRIGLFAGLLTLSISLVACTNLQMDNTYLGDSQVKAYSKAPGIWEVSTIQENPFFSLRSFSEEGLTSNDLMKPTDKVTGLIGRRAVDSETPVPLDDLGLNMVFSDVNAAIEAGDLEVLSGPLNFTINDKAAKVMLYTVKLPEGVVKVKQIWVIDPLAGYAYGIAAGCSIECYDTNEKVIDTILGSFTVSK